MSAPSGTLAGKYWLGETFEETYEEVVRSCAAGTVPFVFAAHLHSTMADFKSSIHQLSASVTGWAIPQYEGASGSYAPENLEKLFRFHAIQEGEQGLDLNIHIENIKIAETGNPSPYGRFDVVVRQKRGDKIYTVDSYENLSLNPNSDNFIARRIGDQHFEWDPAQKRNKVYGNYPNNSSYVRVEMNGDVGENGPDNPRSVPFGFLGPIKKKDITITAAAPKFVLTGWAEIETPAGAATTVCVSGSDSLTLRWPTAPHVTTGSAAPGLNVNYTLGGTPYNRKTGTNDISYASVNRGMKDYLRKFASQGSNASNTDQASGIADNSNNVHSYIFSLDEVHITGASTPGSDLSNFAATGIEFVSGSHRGGISATATVTCGDGDSAHDSSASQKITIQDANGKIVDYFISDTNDGGPAHLSAVTASHKLKDTGPVLATLTAGATGIAVGYNLSGPTTDNGVLVLLKAAIESSNGHNGTITVSSVPAQVNGNQSITLTQATRGQTGNAPVSSNIAAISAVTAFTGGQGPKSKTAYTASGSAAALLDLVDSFCMPMAGGSDGVDITEADPFNMSTRTVSGKTTRSSYAYASIDRAIELIRDPEAIEMNLAAMPGITNTTLTTKLIQVCEARADALAVIDLPDVYIPPFEAKCSSFKDRVNNTTPAKSAKNLVARQINSSYGATYYPWVKVRDTINGRDIWAPPSIIALGVMGYTEQRDEVWFAPAGFNRGGLNEGNSGLPVLQVSEQLLSSQRDRLYEANINPIASFVSEGLVVFGQKTLQMTPSALDRINVRRLLIFVKKEISRIANGLLFDQNVPSTWNRFTGQVVPFLEGVKTRLGLTDFKVVLDSTTTTADLIDRNIMYAKIFLKPARAIEFIAVDFVITRTGASFDD